MKKKVFCLFLGLVLTMNIAVIAAPHGSCSKGGNHHSRGSYHHRGSSSSSSVYLVRKEFNEKEEKFANCDRHFLLTETTTNHYSDGTRRIYKYYTVFNSDGSTLISSASDIKHLIYENKHYFIARLNGSYKIVKEDGTEVNHKKYSSMSEIAPNKLLVKADKKYGVIDLTEKTIIPIKYKKFERVGENLFLTNLNGYYGMLDNSNNILIKNEYDKIKPLYETFLLKIYGKYGLANSNGEIVLPPNYHKIKKLGEYILVKKNKRYGILDYSGNWIGEVKYKKIRLKRNVLEGLLDDNTWHLIPTDTKVSPIL